MEEPDGLLSLESHRVRELRVRRGREMKAAPREGTGRRWLGGDPTRRLVPNQGSNPGTGSMES